MCNTVEVTSRYSYPTPKSKEEQKLTGCDTNQWWKIRNILLLGVTPLSTPHPWEPGNWTPAWESPLVKAKFRLIHSARQRDGTQRIQLDNSAYNHLAANLSSFFFFSWSQQGDCILLSRLCLWLIRKAGVLGGNLWGVGNGGVWSPVPFHSRLWDLYVYYWVKRDKQGRAFTEDPTLH